MFDFDEPGSTLERPVKQRQLKQRPTGARFGDLGDRLARAAGVFERATRDVQRPEWSEEPTPDPDWEPSAPVEPQGTPFRLVWRGYERAAVDDYLADVEHELAAGGARPPTGSSVEEEIDRIGDQTAAILRVAHDQADAVTRRAQTEADRCVAEAQSRAIAITEGAKQQLLALDGETDFIWRERERLITDIRALASGLWALAQDAADRFPAEPETAGPTGLAAPDAGGQPANGRVATEPQDP